jgi:histidinol-phosphate aminotransferase
MPPPVAEVLNRVRQPFNVNLLAQEAAIAALEDKAFLQQTLHLVHTGLDDICVELDRLGLTYQPSQTNFVLIAVNRPAEQLFEALLRRGIIVRPMNAYGFPEHIRVNVGRPDENHQLIAALEIELGL